MRIALSNQAIRRIATYKKSTLDAEIWDRVDHLIELMGEKEFIEALIKAMSPEGVEDDIAHEAEETIAYIEQMYGV